MQVQTNSAATATAATTAGGPAALTSDFTTFLRMLTVQMQNQDPLNPMEATDFAVQLATFSGVEQQVQTNQLLEQLAGQFSILGMAQLAGWIGQDARAAADVVWFDGAPVELAPQGLPTADKLMLSVHDETGKLVAREELPPGTQSWMWEGKDALGATLSPGRYMLTLENWRGEELLSHEPVEYYSRVVEARGSASGPVLVLEGGVEVPASAVTGLRAAAG